MPNAKYRLLLLFWIYGCASSTAQSEMPFVQLVNEAEKETAARNWPQALIRWQQVYKQNPVHHNYTYQLGNASYQTGKYQQAIEYFEKGFELSGKNSYYGAFNVAKAYAKMGDKSSAMTWLKRSFDLGMPNRSELKSPVFDALKDMPAYRQITATDDLAKLDRIEGWRYDLNFLKDEITRKAFHVIRPITKETLDQEVKRIHEAIPRLTDMQITVELMKLLVKVGDGHTMLYAMRDNAELRKNIPVEFFWFKEGLYIVQAEKRFENLLGAKVIAIENKSPQEIFAALQPIMSRDNEQTLKIMSTMKMRQSAVLHALGIARMADQLSLRLIDRIGKEMEIKLMADSEIPSRRLWDGLPQDWISLDTQLPEKPLYVQDKYRSYWFRYLPAERSVWFQYNQVLDDPADRWTSFLDSLFGFIQKNDVQKLIIDLRNNNGGNGELSYALIHQIIRSSKINQPGKLFVITGRKTFSAAGICISLLEKHTRCIFAGEPAGTSPNFIGEEFEFELPYSHLFGNISDREHHYANAVDYRVWISPTIYVDPSFADFLQGRDKVWEMILASYPTQ